VEPTGFFADLTVDAVGLPDCESAEEAYSLVESLRVGASEVLEMDLEDLQVVALPIPGFPGWMSSSTTDARRIGAPRSALRAVWRSRGGGDRGPQWLRIRCERSCIDCLQTFRNAFYHSSLNRQLALEKWEGWRDSRRGISHTGENAGSGAETRGKAH